MAQKEKQLLFKNLYGKLPYGMVTVQEKITRIMTTEEKQLLLKDLCGRLPYGVKIHLNLPDTMENGYTLKEINTEGETVGVVLDRGESLSRFKAVRVENEYGDLCVKPYLRPMSSMTEREKDEIKPLFSEFTDELGKRVLVVRQNKMTLYQDWLNTHHFDFRGLIEKGLALETPENMYKIE